MSIQFEIRLGIPDILLLPAICCVIVLLTTITCSFPVQAQTSEVEWKKVESGTLSSLLSIQFIDGSVGFISGSHGTLLSTRDGGATWSGIRTGTSDTVLDVHFADSLTGWLLCERDPYSAGGEAVSYLLATTDGGESWQKTELELEGSRLVGFAGGRGTRPILVGQGGGYWERFEDTGRWVRRALPVAQIMFDGARLGESYFVLVGAGGLALVSEDNGSSWRTVHMPSVDERPRLNAVSFVGERLGWASGRDGKIFHTENGGKTWTEQMTGVKEDLSDICFINSLSGYAVGEHGLILRTSDGGKVWKREPSATKHRLEGIAVTGDNLFAVGYGGVILTLRRGR